MKFLKLSFLFLVSFSQAHNLVDIEKLNPEIVLDIKYATRNNFTNEVIYSKAKCFLVEEVANALNNAAKDFAQLGYKLKVWDGYTPQAMQLKLWNTVKRKFSNPEKYVSDPIKGCTHNCGVAVDLTLVDKDGKELNMGSEFDDFSEKSCRDCKDTCEEIKKNRKLLEDGMMKRGFSNNSKWWWHFDYTDAVKNPEKYPLLDKSFEALEEIQK